MAIDLSRSAFDARKRYGGVRTQMGRVLSDDDFNAAGEILEEERRRAVADVVGPAGTPDDGFAISNVTVNGGAIDFDIGAGTLYLGGLRLDTDGTETFQVQEDWLQQEPGDRPAPPAGGAERFDVVWLEAVLQDVTAVEDNELLEVAFGVWDTSARTRVVRRVRVTEDVAGDSCDDGWAGVLAELAGEGDVGADHELAGDARLTVTFAPGGDPADLCSPTAAGGYLGAENQAIRVQLVDDGQSLTWGFDNATPLYRVRVGTDAAGARRVITMLTEPPDQPHWPLAGQVVELLPWSAVLPNGEKLAERTGLLARVDGSYDPDTAELTIATPVPAGFGEAWKTRPDAGDLGDEFLYMRVWDRGGDAASPLAIPCPDGTAVPLGTTGVSVTVDGAMRAAGDHWIVAARPHTPTRVVPWDLEEGRPPHGFRRWVTPLAIVRWNDDGTAEVVEDCRDWFPPLTRVRNCCTVTAGRGGRFASIQAAIDALPESGGQVCVLPGEYEENVLIENRVGITLSGCGLRTLVRSVEGAGEPVVRIRGCIHVTVRDLLLIADDDAPGVLVEAGGDALLGGVRPREIRLHDLAVGASRRGAIEVHDGRVVEVRSCRLLMEDVASAFPALFFTAEDGLIERNEVRVAGVTFQRKPFEADAALGGIQLAGTCERVRVRDNLVQGGIGNGITLGSVRIVDEDGDDVGDGPVGGGGVYDPCDPCRPGGVIVVDPGDGGDGGGRRIISAGPLADIEIEDNRILDMGLCGIGVVGFWPAGAGEVVIVETLEISRNEIRRCLQRELAEPEEGQLDLAAFGGISLAAVSRLTVRENVVEENGRRPGSAVCGVFVLLGEGVEIADNSIRGNGPAGTGGLRPGRRAGIDIVACTTPPRLEDAAGPQRGIEPALRVSDNVVCQPVGPALSALALGPVHVHGNHLTSEGIVGRAQRSTLSGATVTLFQLGSSWEAGGLYAGGYAAMAKQKAAPPEIAAPASPTGLLAAIGRVSGANRVAGGNLLFADNQCLLAAETDARELRGLASVLVLSLDDTEIADNQLDVRLDPGVLVTNALLAGLTLRVDGNGFKEGIGQVGWSAYTIGLMNVTAHNEAIHCVKVVGVPALTVDDPNVSLIGTLAPQYCRALDRVLTTTIGALG